MSLGRLKNAAASVKDAVDSPRNIETINYDPKELLPSGCTWLNCACSDYPYGAFKPGTIINITGDSSAGKSMLALTSLADIVYLPKFSDYDLYYNDAEHAGFINIKNMFGKEAYERINTEYSSDNLEEFINDIFEVIERDRPFAFILDSWDAIQPLDEFDKMYKKYVKKDPKVAGSMDMQKQKMMSKILSMINSKIEQSQGLFVIVCQTRDNVGATGYGAPKDTRSGGRALKFYSTHEIWLKHIKEIKEKSRSIGNRVRAKVSKNKLTGKRREAEFDIYNEYGVDDISSCVSMILEDGGWKKTKQTIHADLYGDTFDGTISKVIEWIEDDQSRIKKMRRFVGEVWLDAEEEVRITRPRRYPE